MTMLGPTPGEQYLAFLGLDDHTQLGDIAQELDDAIFDTCEEVIRDRKADDPLLRALLHDGCALWTWAPYPAGRLPAGTQLRLTDHYGLWEGRTQGPDAIRRRPGGLALCITWTHYADNRFGNDPFVRADDVVDAWVPIPCDLAPLAGPPTPDAPAGPAMSALPAVTWDDPAEGQIIRFWYHNRSQRLGRRAAKRYLARVWHVWRPEDLGRSAQVGLEVLKADLTRHQGIGYHTLHAGPEHYGLADIIEIVHQPPAATELQEPTGRQ